MAVNTVCMILGCVSGYGVLELELQGMSHRLLVVMVDYMGDGHGCRWCGNCRRRCTAIKASRLAQLCLHTFGNVCLGMLVEMVLARECLATLDTGMVLVS